MNFRTQIFFGTSVCKDDREFGVLHCIFSKYHEIVNYRIPKNSTRNVKEVSFFYFSKEPVQQEKWKISTGCEPNKYSTVCELHFDTDDVITNINRKKLKKGAIPSPCEPHPPNAAVGYARVTNTKGKSTHAKRSL